METDRRAIARNWVLAQEKRKLEQEEREAEWERVRDPPRWGAFGVRPNKN